MRWNRIWGLAFLGLFLLSCPVQGAGVQQAATSPEPAPLVIVQQMCDYLKSLSQFSFRSEILDDQVYYGGKKLQYGIDTETYVRRPDRLRVNAEGDLVNKEFYFNGKTITLYDKDDKVYGIMEVPPNIEGALDKAHKDFGLRVALADLASPLLCDHISKGLENSLYVGMHKVRGVPCHHLSFDGEDVQLQVWIDAGDQPLPRKVVLNHKNLPASPQWTAYLSDWNFAPQLNENLFAFTPPQGTEKIKFIPVQASQAPKQKPEKQKKGGKS
jgi:hypothetical protein